MYFDLTLMTCEPSSVEIPNCGTKPLRRACTTNAFVGEMDANNWKPRRSSGSANNCCIKLIPSWETRGRDEITGIISNSLSSGPLHVATWNVSVRVRVIGKTFYYTRIANKRRKSRFDFIYSRIHEKWLEG